MVSVDKNTFEFQNGKLNNYLDETIYVGSFYKNKYEGDGEFYYKDKIIFRGLFQDNFYKKGLYYDYPNQRIIDGVWKKQNKVITKGTFDIKSKNIIYEGDFILNDMEITLSWKRTFL